LSYEIIIISDELRKIGFELAGIAGVFAVKSKADVMSIIRQVTRERNVGIIIISDQFLPETDEFQQLMKKSFPAIISVPCSGKQEGESTSQQLREFIQRSIGISIEI